MHKRVGGLVFVASVVWILGSGLCGAGEVRVPTFDIPVVEYDLPNGLRLLIHEDHTAPAVASYLFVRSGSGNEQIGATGMAHLFEHMMFNGSAKFGAGTFDDLLEGAGGSTNGFTTRDFTVYLNNFPPEALDLVLELEADRMARLLITAENLEQERGIVKEERRLRVDNDPMATMDEQLYLQAFVASPYRWPVVGFMADLNAITLEAARAYFRRYYAPNNTMLVLSGDVEAERARRSVLRTLGRIPSQPPPATVLNVEPPQLGPRRARVQMAAELPAVLIGYHAPAVASADRPALDVLDTILSSGDSSRLHRRLVYEKELATSAWSSYDWLKHPGLFTVYAQARPGVEAGELERELLDVVAGAVGAPPVEAELQKAKNVLTTDHVRAMKTVGGKAFRLGYYRELFGDHRALFDAPAQWEAVSAADVVRVAGAVLVRRNRTTVVLVPEPRS
jgi:predicted Zn-dependent peptidase